MSEKPNISRSVSKDGQEPIYAVSHTPQTSDDLNNVAVYSSYTFKTADLRKVFASIAGSDTTNSVKALEVILKPYHVVLTQTSTISLDSGREEQALYLAATNEDQIKNAVEKLGLMGAPGKPKSIFRSTSRELLVTPAHPQGVYPGQQHVGSKPHQSYATAAQKYKNTGRSDGQKPSSQNADKWAKYSPISESEFQRMEEEYQARKVSQENFNKSLKHTIEVLKTENRERANTFTTPSRDNGLMPPGGESSVKMTRTVSSPPKFSPGSGSDVVMQDALRTAAQDNRGERAQRSMQEGSYGGHPLQREHSGNEGKYQVPQRRADRPPTLTIPRLRNEASSPSPTRQAARPANPNGLLSAVADAGFTLSSAEGAQWGPYGGRQEQPTFSATAPPFISGRRPVASMPTYDAVWPGPMVQNPMRQPLPPLTIPAPVKTGNPYNPGSGLQPPVNPSSYPSLEQLQLRAQAAAAAQTSPHRYPPDIQRALDKSRQLRFESPQSAKDPRQFLRFNENLKPKNGQFPDDMFALNAIRAAEAATQQQERASRNSVASGPKFSNDVAEDEELSIENNIPYRLRPPPLTGPRFIR